MKTYVRSNGDVVKIEDMETEHISRAIAKMEREKTCHLKPNQYVSLCVEFEHRKDKWEEWNSWQKGIIIE